jgi:hypothetical protein
LTTINRQDALLIEGTNKTGEILEPVVARTGTRVATVPEVEGLATPTSLASVTFFKRQRPKVGEPVEIYKQRRLRR